MADAISSTAILRAALLLMHPPDSRSLLYIGRLLQGDTEQLWDLGLALQGTSNRVKTGVVETILAWIGSYSQAPLILNAVVALTQFTEDKWTALALTEIEDPWLIEACCIMLLWAGQSNNDNGLERLYQIHKAARWGYARLRGKAYFDVLEEALIGGSLMEIGPAPLRDAGLVTDEQQRTEREFANDRVRQGLREFARDQAKRRRT